MAVIVLGSINIDLVATVERIPAPGETLTAQRLAWSPGGKGANQALAARRMGAETILLGTVGEDGFAIQALQLLRRDGVDLSRVDISPDAQTGMAMISVDRSGQNAITVFPGANRDTGMGALKTLEELIEPSDILVLQNEIRLAVVEQAVAIAHRIGARVMWDPAPADAHFPKSLLGVDLLVPNQVEAGVIAGQPVTDVKSAKAVARRLRTLGAKVAVVKLGAEGLVWATQAGVFYLPGETVRTVDTVGAGDAFAGCLAALLAKKENLAEAVRIANRAAALSTTKPGAQTSFPRSEEVVKGDKIP